MIGLLQRVTEARAVVDTNTIGEIGAGLLVLIGVEKDDTEARADRLLERLLGYRVFSDEDGRMNLSLLDISGTLGVVSQFTLYGDTRHGRRPSFVEACPAEQAAPLIEAVVDAARALGASVVTGRFQASMELSLVNSGPVTLLMDTEKIF